MDSFTTRLKHGWHVFKNGLKLEDENYSYQDLGAASYDNPGRVRLSSGSERSIVSTITNRIALDVASFDFNHVRVDQNGRYLETMDGPLNECLTVEANKDQTGRAFIQDVVMSMFDEGVVAIVPTETTANPIKTGGYSIDCLRTGRIVTWYPDHVRVEVYDDILGVKREVTLPKHMVGIVENPLYAIMNEPNSTLKRLIRALNLLDITDEKNNSGKLDLIIQLPYSVRSETRQKQADDRIKALTQQLEGSKYGIAYADGTERITQLNRPVENALLTKVQYLTGMFYNQLGMSENIFTGKASPQELQNYYDRTVEPIVTAIIDEMIRKFLTKTARTQGQSIMGFRDIFRLIPATELANLADVFSRNEIFSANDWRQILGRRPSDDPRANELSNKNMPETSQGYSAPRGPSQAGVEDPVEPTKDRATLVKELDKIKRDLDGGLFV